MVRKKKKPRKISDNYIMNWTKASKKAPSVPFCFPSRTDWAVGAEAVRESHLHIAAKKKSVSSFFPLLSTHI